MWWKWLGVMVCGVGANVDAAPVCEVSSGTRQMPVIELFTSEGCSSCPPADAWLARQNPDKAILLAWHVDYWNHLGWPDPLSQPAFSQRQIQQAGRFGAQVYTPQFMLNGEPQASGTLPSAAGSAPLLQLQARAEGDGWRVRLTAGGAATESWQYRLVVVGETEQHRVPRGENAGRSLPAPYPVLAYWQLSRPDANFVIPRPPLGVPVRLVAWVEQRQRILQAVALPLQTCAGSRLGAAPGR